MSVAARALVGALVGVLATAGGAVIGFVATLGIVVAMARAGQYVFALEELVALRWETLPIVFGAAAGAVLAATHPRALDRATGWGFGALAAGILVGIPAGHTFWGPGEGQWAGGIIFGALGLVAGIGLSLAIDRPKRRDRPPLFAGGLGGGLLLAGGAFVAMGFTRMMADPPVDLPEFEGVPLPQPDDVDAVVFLLGDAGATTPDRSPLLPALSADVERWSTALGQDSAVSVVFLGDLVYPLGVRDRTHPDFPSDSIRLWSQIRLLGGEKARARGSTGLFLPGNHDWGSTSGEVGRERIGNLAAQLDAARDAGFPVALYPPAGQPGPTMRELRSDLRLILMDTHWFLQTRSGRERAAFFDRLGEMIGSAGERNVVLAAHHPFRSAGPHGLFLPGYHAGGVAYLLKKSGTLVQDLNSPVYEEFLGGLRGLFERLGTRPLVFAGGHDHSLQVLESRSDHDPRFSLVSGAGSKISSIGYVPGLAWAASRPGYMMLVARRDGGVDLFVIGGDPDRLVCDVPEARLEACMAAGIAAFEIRYSTSLLVPPS